MLGACRCCRLRNLFAAAGCLILAQLAFQLWWATPFDAQRESVARPVVPSVILLHHSFAGSDASDFWFNMAMVLQHLGRYEVHVVAFQDGPLLQDFRSLGISAKLCDGTKFFSIQLEGSKDLSFQSLIASECGVGRAQTYMFFTDIWASALAHYRKEANAGSLIWFFFRLDRCSVHAEQRDTTEKAMALADHVIFLTEKERSRWQRVGSSMVHVFRPFVNVDLLIEHSHPRGQLPGTFVVTLELSHSPPPDFPQIERALSQRFGDGQWRLVVFPVCEDAQLQVPKNMQVTYDKETFYQHMLNANLSVVLDSSMAPSWSTMYASALGVPSLVSGEHVLRTGVDGYLLTSQTSLPHFFEHLNTSELLPVGLAARESQRRFSMEAAPARVSFLLDSIQSSKPKNAGGVAGMRIAMFLQMHNASLWWSLYSCMENVLLAANTSRSVDLFVITTSEDSAAQLRSLTSGLKANFATLRHVVVALGVNKGADIGLFLQQLLLNLEMQLEVDVIFKLHSKRKELWRSWLVESLCGSVQVVRRNLEALETSPNIGIIGPSNLTWSPDSKKRSDVKMLRNLKKASFNDVALNGMNTTWAVMDTGYKFPARKHWIICAGSFFWMRASHVMNAWQKDVIPVVPRILALSANYSTGCDKAGVITCLLAVGLERILPTLVKASGGKVVEAPTFKSPK